MLALAPVQQDYLLEAHQMQALSFAVHIPLVCFGVGFPAMVLFVEWLYMRSGDQLYLTLAKRWTKVMVALFAVGCRSRVAAIPSTEATWPHRNAGAAALAVLPSEASSSSSGSWWRCSSGS